MKSVYDFEAQTVYTPASIVRIQRSRLSAVFNATEGCPHLPSKRRFPVILANNAASTYSPAAGNARALLQTAPGLRPLDGYSLESFAGQEVNNDPYHSGCNASALRLVYRANGTWRSNVQLVMDAAQSNLALFPMVAQAGCKSVYLEMVNKTTCVAVRWEITWRFYVSTPDNPLAEPVAVALAHAALAHLSTRCCTLSSPFLLPAP